MTEKLQKIIAAAGLMSRRSAEELISAGRVTVNGAVAALGDRADAAADSIAVDGKALPKSVSMVYIMLNKPKGYVTTMSDEMHRPCVTELVKDAPGRVYPVGRLDMHSEGLLVLTNDGELANTLTHPSHNMKKTYHTWVHGAEPDKAVETLRSITRIDALPIRPCQAQVLERRPDGALLSVSIWEGRNRQVRKMCLLAGLRVERLLRVSEGPLELGELKSGQWRYLSDAELKAIRGWSNG